MNHLEQHKDAVAAAGAAKVAAAKRLGEEIAANALAAKRI